LLEHPGCPAEVRLGIAACMFKLGDLAGATAAYERVLALDPECATAHLGLAIIKFNSINLQQVGTVLMQYEGAQHMAHSCITVLCGLLRKFSTCTDSLVKPACIHRCTPEHQQVHDP
jgi:hypothetical protein